MNVEYIYFKVHLTVLISERVAKVIVQTEGVRWVEKSRLIGTGSASGWWREAYFLLVPLSGIVTFSSMEKVREKVYV